MAVVRYIVALLTLVVAGCGFAQGSTVAGDKYPVVNGTLQPTSATIGQQLKLSVTVVAPELTRISVKAPFAESKDTTWSLIGKPDSRDEKIGSNEWKRQIEYTIATFETGEIPGPKVEVTYQPPGGGEAIVRTIPQQIVRIGSLLPPGTAQLELRDIKAPLPLPYPRWIFWAAATAALVVVALIAWIIWKRIRGKVGSMLRPPKTLDEWALSEIMRAENDRLIEQKKYKELYTRLSDTVRLYLGKLHEFPAMDMTTGELLFQLEDRESEQQSRHVPQFREARVRIVALMDESDLVKFAKFVPETSKCRQAIERAREIVRLTRYKLNPEPEDQRTGTDSSSPPPPLSPPEEQDDNEPIETQVFSPNDRREPARTGAR